LEEPGSLTPPRFPKPISVRPTRLFFRILTHFPNSYSSMSFPTLFAGHVTPRTSASSILIRYDPNVCVMIFCFGLALIGLFLTFQPQIPLSFCCPFCSELTICLTLNLRDFSLFEVFVFSPLLFFTCFPFDLSQTIPVPPYVVPPTACPNVAPRPLIIFFLCLLFRLLFWSSPPDFSWRVNSLFVLGLKLLIAGFKLALDSFLPFEFSGSHC